MIWNVYDEGTVSIGAGATVAVGTGTEWGVLQDQAWVLFVNGLGTVVREFTDDTHATIKAWAGGAVTNVGYELVQFPVASLLASEQLGWILTKLSGIGVIYYIPPGQEPVDEVGDDGDFARQRDPIREWVKVAGHWELQPASDLGEVLGTGTTTGSGDAYVLTVTSGQTAYVHGHIVIIKASFTNGSASTLKIINGNGVDLGAKAIRQDGDVRLFTFAIQSGAHYILRFDSAANGASGAWMLLNPGRRVIAGNFFVIPNILTNNQFVFDVGTGGAGTSITGYCQPGTIGSPTAVVAGQEIGFIQYFPWDGASFSGTGVGPLALVAAATQNHTPSHRGAGWLFQSIHHDSTLGQNEVFIQDGLTALAAGEFGAPGKGLGTVWAKNGFFGSATNDNASAGAIGEYLATAAATNNNANATVTMTIAAPCVVTWAAHGFTVGAVATAVKFTTTGALPTGITAGTTYYLKAIDANTFNIATTAANALAGTVITTTGSQSGTHTADIRVSMASNTRQDIAAITLAAGDWDVSGQMLKGAGASTTVTYIGGNITTASITVDRTFGRRLSFQYGGLVLGNNEFTVFNFAPSRFSLAAPTTIFLVADDVFAASTMTCSGWLKARRVR